MSISQILLLLAGGQGILLSLGLITSGLQKNRSNLFLGLFTLVIAIEILTILAVQVNYTIEAGRIAFWNLSSYLIWPPALLLFSWINTNPNFTLKKWHWLLFLPAILEILIELITDLSNSYYGTNLHPYQHPIWFAITEIVPIIAIIMVLFLFGKSIYQLEKRVKSMATPKVGWYFIKLKGLHLLFSLITLLWVLEAIFQLDIFQITVSVLCAFIFILAYISFFNPHFFQLPSNLAKSLAPPNGNAEAQQKIAQQIHQQFQEKHIYQQPKLTLKEAASQLGIPARTLSETINQTHGVDFRRYVNTLRIESVIRKVEAGEKEYKTLLALALEAGFGSKSAFNQAFKDIKGKSPSDFFRHGS